MFQAVHPYCGLSPSSKRLPSEQTRSQNHPEGFNPKVEACVHTRLTLSHKTTFLLVYKVMRLVFLLLLSLLPGCLPTNHSLFPTAWLLNLSISAFSLCSLKETSLRFHLCWSLTSFQHLSEHPRILQTLVSSSTCACQQPSWRASSSGQH